MSTVVGPNLVWLELMMGRYQHVVEVQWPVGRAKHLLTVRLVRDGGKQTGVRLISVRFGSSQVIYCEVVPLTTLYQMECPLNLTPSQRQVWQMLRHQFRQELRLITSSFMRLCVAHYPRLRVRHLWSHQNQSGLFRLPTAYGDLCVLRQLEQSEVSLTLIAAAPTHALHRMIGRHGPVTVKVRNGVFASATPHSLAWHVAEVFRTNLHLPSQPPQLFE